MTVRLPAELDARLSELSQRRQVSKHALIVEAVERLTQSEAKMARVLAVADEVSMRYADTLQRLEDA